jgi:putative effector of murein hydrolase LrgA (UPF0299 family)
MIVGLACLFGLAAAGELAARALGVPVGGAVLGLVVLIVWLAPRRELPPALARAADGLLAELGMLFVPAAAGLIAHWPLLKTHGLGLALALCCGTLAGLVAAACVFAAIRRSGTVHAAAETCQEPAA